MEKLEEGKCVEALLLTNRMRLCELAANLYERVSVMPLNELHRTLQPLQGIELPTNLECKLISRRCLEALPEDDLTIFWSVWRPWEADGDEGVEDFDAMKPDLRSLIGSLCDREAELKEEEDQNQNVGKSEDFNRRWQAGASCCCCHLHSDTVIQLY